MFASLVSNPFVVVSPAARRPTARPTAVKMLSPMAPVENEREGNHRLESSSTMSRRGLVSLGAGTALSVVLSVSSVRPAYAASARVERRVIDDLSLNEGEQAYADLTLALIGSTAALVDGEDEMDCSYRQKHRSSRHDDSFLDLTRPPPLTYTVVLPDGVA